MFALLSWHARLAPLVGRERDQDALLQWARQGRNARIRLLSGPGGVGKSRLAAEVAEALRGEGWTAGFIRPNDPIVVPLRRAGLFLVVDYPEEHPDEVRTLLREVAFRELRDVPVRRQGGDRWSDLVESAHAGELMDSQEVGLSGLAAADPEYVFSEASGRLADHYRRSMPAVSADAVRRWVALDPPLHGLPLLLTAAAVQAFFNPDAALGLSGRSVVQALADRERARLDSAVRAAGLGARGASRVVALAAVPGSIDAAVLRRLANPMLELGLPAPDRVVDAVSTAPWWRDGRVPAPQPDIMAAALLLKILSERSDKAPEWLWTVMEHAVTPPLVDRLGRLAFDAMTVTGSATEIIRHFSEIVRNDPSRAQKLKLLAYEGVPFVLASFASDIIRTLLTTITDEIRRARLLNHLSESLKDAGDGDGALAAIREAVDTYRRLPRDKLAHFAPDIAASLFTLSIRLSDAGDRAGALGAASAAVSAFRLLAQDDPAAFAPNLGGSLNNLSLRLREAGDATGALAASREAVDIHRRLAQDNPADFAADLASSLNNLSLGLHDAGDGAGAVAASRGAVDTYRRLMQDNPARVAPDLAQSLNNLSAFLTDEADLAVALEASREAVELRRRLAHDNPGRFAPDLAQSLNTFSTRLRDAGDGASALAAIREAVAIRRRLARDNPARFDPDLALDLHNFSVHLSDAGDGAGALVAIREAVEIRRRLARDAPARFDADLAMSLDNLSVYLSDAGDGAGELEAIHEAVETYRRLAQGNPARFDLDLANSLDTLSECLSGAGDSAGALAAIREAVDIRRRLAQDDPERFGSALERSLKILEALERV